MNEIVVWEDSDSTLTSQEWYQELVEDCKNILVEGEFAARWIVIQTYWQLGQRICQEVDVENRAAVYGQKIRQRVSESLGKSRQTIDCAINFYRQYPDPDNWPFDKAISWRRICHEYLPAPKQTETPLLPEGQFRIIYADPPWQYDNTGFTQSAEQHYPTMTTKDICALPISDLVGDEAVLFLWVTSPFLPDGLEVCRAWGFDYKTSFVWVKHKAPGVGWFARTKHEFLLVAVKGQGMHPQVKLDSVFYDMVTEHSRKPDSVPGMIEQMYEGPYLELFARRARAGWAVWGNEV